jgi:hypothetical protein
MTPGWKKVTKQACAITVWGSMLYACFGVLSCKNHQQPATAAPAADSTMVFYPINNYLRQQVKDVDSTPYYVYRVLVVNGKKDSTTINRTAFDSLAKQFILPELEAALFRKNFTESVYEDESTNSVTLTYTPTDSTLRVQSAMVLLDPESQDVKWIFINTLENRGDSSIIQKIGWKGNERSYINRSVSYANGKESQMQLNIVWNKH